MNDKMDYEFQKTGSQEQINNRKELNNLFENSMHLFSAFDIGYAQNTWQKPITSPTWNALYINNLLLCFMTWIFTSHISILVQYNRLVYGAQNVNAYQYSQDISYCLESLLNLLNTQTKTQERYPWISGMKLNLFLFWLHFLKYLYIMS